LGLKGFKWPVAVETMKKREEHEKCGASDKDMAYDTATVISNIIVSN